MEETEIKSGDLAPNTNNQALKTKIIEMLLFRTQQRTGPQVCGQQKTEAELLVLDAQVILDWIMKP